MILHLPSWHFQYAKCLCLLWPICKGGFRMLEVEDEAKQAAESYTDVEHVEVQGGLLGMDQHTPPPAPAILSKEERRSEDSGYIRPLRRRI